MKKTLITLAMAVSCLSSFGQGYFIYANSAGTAVWDNFRDPVVTLKATNNVQTAIVYSLNTGAVLSGVSLGTNAAVNPEVAWSTITGNSAFTTAVNATSGAMMSAPCRTGLTIGTFSGGTVGIQGLSAGTQVAMAVVAWSGGSWGNSTALGWSNTILLTLGSSAAPGLSLNAAGMQGFGVYPVPEPSTFALAGLGAAAMLIFRRRK